MKCPRCEEVMVLESFPDWKSCECLLFEGWHCMVCGHLLHDPVLPGENAYGAQARQDEPAPMPSTLPS